MSDLLNIWPPVFDFYCMFHWAAHGLSHSRGTGIKSIRKITISLLIQEHLRKLSPANMYNCAEFGTGQ